MGTHSDEGRPQPALKQTMLRGPLLRQAARALSDLDSRLEGISYLTSPAGPMLVYTFDLPGHKEIFEVLVEPTMDSLADIYPAAALMEADLAEQHGVDFQSHEEDD